MITVLISLVFFFIVWLNIRYDQREYIRNFFELNPVISKIIFYIGILIFSVLLTNLITQ